MKLPSSWQRGLALVALAAGSCLVSASPVADPKETFGLLHYVRPNFPILASSQGIFEGAAWVAVGWDDLGYARDVLVLRATHPAVGRAVAEAVSGWRRDPARRRAEQESFVVEFKAEGIVIAAVGASTLLPATALKIDRIPHRADLDAEPRAVQQPMPALPVGAAASARGGRVVVSFYVDESGQVRAVNIVEASAPEFAAATLEALRQWRYAPPRMHGRPTVYVEQWAFDFSRR